MKKIFRLLLACVLLAFSASCLAFEQDYGSCRYMRTDAQGRDNGMLTLFRTQNGNFIDVTVYESGNDNDLRLDGAGKYEHSTLTLENYELHRDGKVQEFLFPHGTLLAEVRLDDNNVELLPTIDAREQGDTKVSNPDIGGKYTAVQSYIGASERMTLVYLQHLNVEMVGLDLRAADLTFKYGHDADKHSRILKDYMPSGAGYTSVEVYRGGKLLMTYLVDRGLWDVYSLAPDGEVRLLTSNDAVG